MAVRDRVVEQLTTDVVGVQWWDNSRGHECTTMPTEAYYQTRDAANVLYERIVQRIDMNRILLEAVGRHCADGHDEDAVIGNICGPCVTEALLAEGHWWDGPRKPVDQGQDWLAVLADMRERHGR